MKETKLWHRLSYHHPFLQQIKIPTVYLKNLLPMGKSLVLHKGRNYPSQLGLYHGLQTKIFALNQGGKRLTSNFGVSKDMQSWNTSKKKQKQKYNFYIYCLAYIDSKLEKDIANCISCQSNCRYLQDNICPNNY